MGTSLIEQETVVNIMRTDDKASIYTSDTVMMNRLDRKVENSKEWELEEEIRLQSGELVAKRYSCPKKLILFRTALPQREITEEQRQAAADRLRDYWAKKREEATE